jgi:hypothetical protein
MWTALALASEQSPIAGEAWRIVESQARIATMKVVDSLAEQELLEAELERSKPAIPAACRQLHWLLATPFRYAPYPNGSRFRRARQREGCLYAAEQIETAVAEDAFYRLRFFLDAPAAIRPRSPQERTAFRFSAATKAGLDLMTPPFLADRSLWMNPSDYSACQELADAARAAQISIIRYASVRDRDQRANWAVLDCRAVTTPEPTQLQTWNYMVRPTQIEAVREMPRSSLTFSFADWARVDPRIPDRLP